LVSYPLVIGSGIVAATAGIIGVDASDEDFWLRLLVSAALGLPLFFAVRITSRKRRWSPLRTWLVRLGGLGILAAFFIGWPGWSEPVRAERLVQAAVAVHLLVAFAPYLGHADQLAFWDYNKTLFLRFLTAALYSSVLFVGLAIALAGVDNLLGFEVDGEQYVRLWLLIAFVFNTWFFLAGTLEIGSPATPETRYPSGLKVFSQYVLIPLVTVYLIILTLYLGRILITRTWPSGWIGYLVSSVAIAGIFSLLLVYPVADRSENRWIQTFARSFYLALLPSIAMLLVAIWQRIDQYGVTERRYFLAVLAIWLSGIALFYVITRSRNILMIPLTLCLLAVLTFGGPWSAYSVSQRSQLDRLRRHLVANDLLDNGRVTPRTTSVSLSFEDRREIAAVLRYLLETHGTSRLEPMLGGLTTEVDSIVSAAQPFERHEADDGARTIMEQLGLAYVTRWESNPEVMFNYFADQQSRLVPIGEYDYAFRWNRWSSDSTRVDGEIIRIWVGPDSASVRIRRGNRELGLSLLTLHDRIRSGRIPSERNGVYPAEALELTGESDWIRVAVYLNSLTGRETEDGPRFWSGGGDVYFRLKPMPSDSTRAPGASEPRPAGSPEADNAYRRTTADSAGS
jgi:hypothetical protein